MFRPERMSDTSIICVKQDVETLLQALNSFGEFHIEQAAEETTQTQYSENIQKAEEALTNVNQLINQLSKEKQGILDVFNAEQPVKIQVTAENWQTLLETTSQRILTPKKEVDDINTSLSGLQEKTKQLSHVKDMLKTIDKTKVDLVAMEELQLIHVAYATLPHKYFDELKKSLESFSLILHRYYLTKATDFIALAVPSKHGLDVEKMLKMHHAEIFAIPKELPHDVTQALNEVSNRLKENAQKEKAFTDSLNKLSKENRNLIAWKEIIENILTLLNAEKKILQSGRLATIRGFVPEKNFEALKINIRGMLGEKALVIRKEPVQNQDPPTKISNNRFIRPFEEITKLWGLPHYDELDPTPLIAITFPIIFGLMFGDIGHGLILLVGGLILAILIKKNQAIKNVCWIMVACGAAAITMGALYGEFFGKEVFAPLWFSPFNNVFDFLIFSLAIGVAQITSGLALEMVNFLIKHNVIDAVFTSIPKLAFYLGAVYLIVVYKLNIGVWFSGPLLLIIVPFVILVCGKPIFISLEKMSFHTLAATPETEHIGEKTDVGNRQEISLGERIFESGDLVTRLLSNSISYTRILALLMAHWALLLAIYTIANLVGFASISALIVSGIIILVGNVFVIGLEGLIVFIHTLRLHFYEWFSKFYEGTGTPFKPFKQKHVYTDVAFKEKQA